MSAIWWVGLGGFLGTVARFKLGTLILRSSGDPTLPVGTLAVNLIGCLAIGILFGAIERQHFLNHDMRLLIITGFLGGFTTFSAFGIETLYLVKRQALGLAAANIAISVVGGLLLVWLGYRLGSLAR